MNHADIIKAAASMPNRIGATGAKLGPRLRVDVASSDSDSVTTIRARSGEPGVPAVSLQIKTHTGRVNVVADGPKGLVCACVMAEHLREQCTGAGPVQTSRSGSDFIVGFSAACVVGAPVAAITEPDPTPRANPKKSQTVEA
jgi:hypothetical protein